MGKVPVTKEEKAALDSLGLENMDVYEKGKVVRAHLMKWRKNEYTGVQAPLNKISFAKLFSISQSGYELEGDPEERFMTRIKNMMMDIENDDKKFYRSQEFMAYDRVLKEFKDVFGRGIDTTA